MKRVTITSKDINPKQWSNLILELNLIAKSWRSFATLKIEGRGVKSIIKTGTNIYPLKDSH